MTDKSVDIDTVVARAPGRGTLESVQVMRGLAATAVAFYHTHLFLSPPEHGGVTIFGSFTQFGWTGVNFFFVLSGFIILLAHERDIGRPARAGRYLWRRFSRVYPVYWVFLTAYIAAAAFGLGQPDFSWSPVNLAASYSLLQLATIVTPPLKVAWTLFFEVIFYGVFLTLILNRVLGMVVIGAWIALIIGVNLFDGPVRDLWIAHTWNLYFLVGAVAYLLYVRLPKTFGLPILIAGVVLLVGAFASGFVDGRIADFQIKPLALFLLSIPFAMILLGGALAEGRYGWNPSASLKLLGAASYAIYLVHSAVISVIVPVLHKHGGHALPQAVVFALVVIPAVAAGIVAHVLVERPLLAWLRNAVSPRTRSAHPSAAE